MHLHPLPYRRRLGAPRHHRRPSRPRINAPTSRLLRFSRRHRR
jgi:hypothetical protein